MLSCVDSEEAKEFGLGEEYILVDASLAEVFQVFRASSRKSSPSDQ